MRNLTLVIGLLALLLSPVTAGVVCAQSQEEQNESLTTPPGIESTDVPAEAEHPGWMQGRHLGWDKEKMLKLKEEDPEQFEQLMSQRRAQVQQRLKKLKEENPQRYRHIKQQLQQKRRSRMQRLKQQNPEKFNEMAERRKAHLQEHLKKLKSEDPEKYEQITQRREQMQQLRQIRKENREKVREYLNQHPQLQNRLQKRDIYRHQKTPRNNYSPGGMKGFGGRHRKR